MFQKIQFSIIFLIEIIIAQNVPDPPNVTNHKNFNLLDHNICGPVMEQKIVGGNKTGVLDFPWMALLNYEVENDNNTYINFLCGGTIINKRFILTAAHCVNHSEKNTTLKKVRVGEHNWKTDPDCDKNNFNLPLVCADNYREFEIEKIIPHPDFEIAITGNDIALIKLNQDIDFAASNNVKPICLPIDSESNLIHGKATTTGWGYTEKDIQSGELLKIHLPIISNKYCKEIYENLGTRIKINYTQICAGGIINHDSCRRDSGCPLQSPTIYNHDVRFVQHGIVSFGDSKCGLSKIPGVYTRVSYFMDWILNNID